MALRVALLLLLGLFATGCILKSSSYRDTDGSLVYVGEVYNGGQPLSNPFVEGFIYDAAGNLIAAQRGAVCQVLPTNGIAAFELRFPPGTPDPARVEFKLQGNAVDNVYLASGLRAEMKNTLVATDGTTFVFGEIHNESANTYHGGYVCAAWVDASGNVLRVDVFGDVNGLRNAPGSVLPFKVQASVPPGAAGVNFYLDAGVSPPPNPPFAFSDLPASAFTNTGPVLSVPVPRGTLVSRIGEVRNNGTKPILPSVFAIVRDASGNLAGVSGGFDICNVAAPPGGATFRGYTILTPLTNPSAPEVRVEAEEQPPGSPVSFYSLETSGETYLGGSGLVKRITGTVRNTSGQRLGVVRVCAGAYDSSGNVIGYGSTFPDLPGNGLAPNATVDFTVELVVTGAVDEVKGVADGF